MPAVTILSDSQLEHNKPHVTVTQQPVNGEITSADILDMLAAMNGERGYAESLDAWAAWDALTRTADTATRARMLEACRQFATVRASALRNGAA